MKLLVGLGNPGRKYSATRHNIGFMVIDALAKKLDVEVDKEKYSSFFGKTKIAEDDVLVVKPQTFMNLSGGAVQAFAGFYKVDPKDILVVQDDIDLPFLKLRIASSSGAGGHNGISSIIERLGTNEFWRLKIGVGRPVDGIDPADFVLSPFLSEEKDGVHKAIDASLEAIITFFKNGPVKAKDVASNFKIS